MVSNTGDGSVSRAATTREARLEQVSWVAVALGAVAMVITLLPETREAAWIPAVPAVILAVCSLGLGVERKRYATLGLVLGWFAFAYSFALMLWG